MYLVRCICVLLLSFLFSSPSMADIWKLKTTAIPQQSYPCNVNRNDLDGILTVYNNYMTAFIDDDFNTMADQFHIFWKCQVIQF